MDYDEITIPVDRWAITLRQKAKGNEGFDTYVTVQLSSYMSQDLAIEEAFGMIDPDLRPLFEVEDVCHSVGALREVKEDE